MTETVYTNYWVNLLNNSRKRHGSYKTEEEALAGIYAWWELQQDNYEVTKTRTNTGALELNYGNDNFFYRIEERQINEPLPEARPKKRSKGEVERLRTQHQLNDETFLFEELPEPYQDRLIVAMNNGKELLEYTFDYRGRPINKLNS